MKLNQNKSIEEITVLYNRSLADLITDASHIHRTSFPDRIIHCNTLVSYKTGGCAEDCAYCAQSARYQTHVDGATFLDHQQVLEQAVIAKESGASRICISASWKNVPNNQQFDEIIALGKEIRAMGLQVCCTLGTANEYQIFRLMDAGFSAYNHNLDTSRDYYPNIISTRSFDSRLEMLERLGKCGMKMCSGGIIGMGESHTDRISMLHTLSSLNPQPYTVPLNLLVPVQGTPLEHFDSATSWEMIRMIAVARILMPSSLICLAAGRMQLSDEAQALCFVVGANSIFVGEQLLTTANPDPDHDIRLIETLGFKRD